MLTAGFEPVPWVSVALLRNPLTYWSVPSSNSASKAIPELASGQAGGGSEKLKEELKEEELDDVGRSSGESMDKKDGELARSRDVKEEKEGEFVSDEVGRNDMKARCGGEYCEKNLDAQEDDFRGDVEG